MKPILVLMIALCSAAAGAGETVTVYQLSGQRQCADGVPVQQAADLLRGQGLKVLAAERRVLPLDISDRCGAPTGEANVMIVAAADWAAFARRNPDAGGYGLWVFEDVGVQIYMYDGTLQCGMGGEIPLAEMADALRAQRIEVLESRKGTDGLAHIAVCGASTGAINIFTIKREDLDAARKLGFRLLVSRELTQRVKRPVARTGEIQTRAQSEVEVKEGIPILW